MSLSAVPCCSLSSVPCDMVLFWVPHKGSAELMFDAGVPLLPVVIKCGQRQCPELCLPTGDSSNPAILLLAEALGWAVGRGCPGVWVKCLQVLCLIPLSEQALCSQELLPGCTRHVLLQPPVKTWARKRLASVQILTEEIQCLLDSTEGENGGVASRILEIRPTPLLPAFSTLCACCGGLLSCWCRCALNSL